MSLEELMEKKAQILNKWEDNINKFIYDSKLEKEYKEIVGKIEKLQKEDKTDGE